MKRKNLSKATSVFLIGAMLSACAGDEPVNMDEKEEIVTIDEVEEEPVVINGLDNFIKIALLLDTSNSMDGLIEQAKSQLWKIVNQLSLAKKNNEFAEIRIALYEYGNDNLNSEKGYIRQVVSLTSDLDEISKELFALTTNGGSEHCGQVIDKSLHELDWEEETGGLQVMFIAGNEEFTQGDVNYEKACSDASKSDVIVNTIFCGDMEQGIQTKWKHGADLTEGFYGTIDMNEGAIFIESPYDDEIQKLNTKLNETYLAYGSQKTYYLENQVMQDNNSRQYGDANAVERTVTKSSHVYKNEAWDLVDAKKEKDFDLSAVDQKDLPDEMKGMSLAEKEAYIDLKDDEREKIKAEIKALNIKRVEYIEKKKEEMGTESNGLDKAMLEAIKKQAIAKNFTFDEV